jgi:NAD(P)-dependent dehydrogenase (short-subunit alcohol dehydrogenase family)
MGRLEGKTALITGGGGGIGRAIALRFGQEGARIVITDRDGAQGQASVAALADAGVAVTFLEHDVADEASWDAVMAQISGLDVLVNNAGVAGPPPDCFGDTLLSEWKRILAVNLDGTFLGTRAGVRAMREGVGGSIINMGSVAAYIGTPGGASYGGSKGGVRSLTKQAAVACARKGYNIRINTIHPSYVWTPLVEQRAVALHGAARAKAATREMHPFNRLAEPVDVANVALFLASDESRMVNAADLVMDGALLAQ